MWVIKLSNPTIVSVISSYMVSMKVVIAIILPLVMNGMHHVHAMFTARRPCNTAMATRSIGSLTEWVNVDFCDIARDKVVSCGRWKEREGRGCKNKERNMAGGGWWSEMW